MKHKNEGNILRKRIMKYFVLVSFGVAVVESAIDSTFEDIIAPRLYPTEAAYRDFDLPHLLYIGVSLLLFFVGAVIFYRLTQKALDQESNRRAQEQNLLYSAIAHDLKTPMTSVQGFASALRDGRIAPEEQPEIFEIIYAKSKRMGELLDTLFEYAKLGTGGYTLRSEPIDAAKIVREAAAESYLDFEGAGMEPETDIDDRPLMIEGDAQEFRRAVTNLIVNAWKHNAPGTRVRITARAAGDELLVSVADSGTPIPAEERAALFDPFTVADKSRPSGKGSGLGLAIAAKAIALMGGTVAVEDAPDEFTKAFVIRGIRIAERPLSANKT